MEDVVVVGTGWAGLAAASELVARGVDPLVLEATKHAGGAAATLRTDGWLLEAGPHAVFPYEPPIARFLQQNPGAAARLNAAAPASAERYVLHSGRRVALPRAPPDLVKSPVLSFPAKLRLLAEPFARRKDAREESVAAFTTRRFGHGVSHLVDAMVTGIFAGDPDRLAATMALPALVEAERTYGSVLKGLRRKGRTPRGPLSAPREGMGPWLQSVASHLRVRLQRRVQRIEGDGPYTLVVEERPIEARRVILAVPPHAAAEMLAMPTPPLPAAPVASVGLGWGDAQDVQDRFTGYGVLNPEREGRFTLGTLYESSLFPGRAPPGGVLVRCLVGGRRHPERVALEDDDLVARARADVLEIHTVTRPPDWAKVLRPPAIPQLELGHAERLRPLVEAVQGRGIATAGWGWSGIGIRDGVQSGQEAAAAVLAP